MKDLFAKEQKIFDDAVNRSREIKDGACFSADEYELLTKEYGRLLKQLRRFTRISDKTTVGLYASNLDLLDKVHYDALTKVYNRRYMEDNLKRILKKLMRNDSSMLSVLMIDIDFFKKYNDTYGHSAGDNCLKDVAKVLRDSVLRADDFVVRYGGEEFTVVLPNTDESGARRIANRILENIRAQNIPHESSTVAECVTVSVGATAGRVDGTQSGEDYIRRADEALYMSKQSGRNRYTFVNFEEAAE